ncbi:MAG TPA: 50S ribosomal protein L13 [Candidatus Saccharimonadales bacterium]|nr:50S ribosomal protein L13 [Candidatus Saccharimonadales bacterium]
MKWYLVDAEGCTLGRLSTVVARHLIGKHRADYAPHKDLGDHVIVVNAGKVNVTGRKRDQKIYRWYTGYPGGLKELPLRKALVSHPERVVEWAVQGMLPKTRLGSRMIRKLKVYAGAQHPHEAQRPEPLDASAARKSA